MGSSGSGKSTLVKLLLRLYDPSSGTVSLDGVDLRELNQQDLRSAIGLVSQEPFLFHGTVADNIRYGSFLASDASVAAAARQAEADGFIQALPDGYNTVVGERGIASAGASVNGLHWLEHFERPPVLTSTATASVDNETEAAIQRSLERITRHRTTIVVAHRLSTVRHADRIVVLDHGQLVEQGDHQGLLEQDGIYARLWKVQSGWRPGDLALR